MGAVEPFGIRETHQKKKVGNPVGWPQYVERSFKVYYLWYVRLDEHRLKLEVWYVTRRWLQNLDA